MTSYDVICLGVKHAYCVEVYIYIYILYTHNISLDTYVQRHLCIAMLAYIGTVHNALVY